MSAAACAATFCTSIVAAEVLCDWPAEEDVVHVQCRQMGQ